jgi:sec-independent protein translocase protein TatA
MNGTVLLAFFTPSGGEIMIVMLVVLLLFGSKNLPKMARTLGRTLEEFRRAAREVSDEITRADADPAPPSKYARPLPSPDQPPQDVDGLESKSARDSDWPPTDHLQAGDEPADPERTEPAPADPGPVKTDPPPPEQQV